MKQNKKFILSQCFNFIYYIFSLYNQLIINKLLLLNKNSESFVLGAWPWAYRILSILWTYAKMLAIKIYTKKINVCLVIRQERNIHYIFLLCLSLYINSYENRSIINSFLIIKGYSVELKRNFEPNRIEHNRTELNRTNLILS